MNIFNDIKGKNLIGDRVRQARHRTSPKVTQTDLLARLAVRGVELEKTTISKIESKTRSVTDIELIAIADSPRGECIVVIRYGINIFSTVIHLL